MATALHDSFAGAALAVRRVQDALTEHTAQQAALFDAKRSARDDERRALDDELAQARRRASEAELDWPAQAAAIEARRADAEQRLNTFERQCIDLGDRRDELLSEVAQLEMEDRLRRARERGWLDRRDISTLPPRLHQYIVMFLDASDLAQMLLVCLPWSRALDHGYVWQAFLGRDTLAARRPKKAPGKSNAITVEPQRNISITLLEMNETLTKDLIFSRALSSLKEQYDEAYSAREDLITQTKVSEQVRDFLLKKTERLKHQLGDTSVEKHRLERTARQDTKVKAALSKRIHMLEKSIADEEKLRDEYLLHSDQELRELDARLKSFGEIQEAAYADKEVEVQQLKTAKKLLVKEVKTLRAEMSTVQAERDAAQSQLEQVKAALATIMRI